MKKASLITIHSINNFGSVLQTIATVKLLEAHGVKTTVVNYQRDQDRLSYALHNKEVKNCIPIIRRILFSPLSIIRTCISRKFLRSKVSVSSPIYSKDDFLKKCPKGDYYITGSDQVWNSLHNKRLDKHYYFDGFPDGVIKIAFSASFGREKLNKDEYYEVKRMLNSYKAISVRESSGKEIVESMGYKVEHILDPTMLVEQEGWSYYATKRKYFHPYIFVYLPYNLHDKDIIYRSAKAIAKNKHLDIVAFSNGILPIKAADRTLRSGNPGEVLSAFYYADYIITNSFHGTAFSINLNKKFFVYMPTGFGTRIASLLKLFTLQNRLLQPDEIVSSAKIETDIDYTAINSLLDKERQKAHTFLSNALFD